MIFPKGLGAGSTPKEVPRIGNRVSELNLSGKASWEILKVLPRATSSSH
jgi:hypothetical protein